MVDADVRSVSASAKSPAETVNGSQYPSSVFDISRGKRVMATILLIDDDELVRRTLTLALRAAGHEVHTAREGREGLQILSSAQPDLVITDIIMPDQEGIETIMQIRKRDSRIPIIAISGAGVSGTLDFLGTATAFGATRVIRKPFRPGVLVDAVRECLGLPDPPQATGA